MEEEERLFQALAENVLYLWVRQKLENKFLATESLKIRFIKKKYWLPYHF